ncbi:hypothetical protein [Psychroserpens damuponensis]|uniref:hypothetical protein n=1 Tax=Psychroserpens damuponensis TaxID=943936 RepID=UPI00058B7EA6|nr:hypothetical protein [Psychroserpens damuponensis]
MKHFIYLLMILFNFSFCQGQSEEPTYLLYEKDMRIENTNNRVLLSFGLQASDGRDCIYNFELDNLSKDFEYLEFEEMKDELLNFDYKTNTILKLDELSKYDFCDLQILLADTKPLFLLKKVNGKLYKYRLVFMSSQRGWSRVDTN